MIAITTLLTRLTRPDVTEVCLTAGQKPTARQGSAIVEIDAELLSADDLLRILFSTGGSRYVESLGARPAQWRTRVEGVGAVNVSAAMNGDIIEARFALRDAPALVPVPVQPPAPPPLAPRSRASTIPPARPRPARASVRPAAGALATPEARRTKPDQRIVRPRSAPPEPPPSSAAPTPRVFELADDARPSRVPTPQRAMEVPRAAMPSEVELDLEVPPVPPGRVPARPPPVNAPVTMPPAAPEQPRPARGTGRKNTQPFGREPYGERFRALLRTARAQGASDLHLVAGRPPLMRLNGQLVAVGDALEAELVENMVLSRVPRRLEEILARDGSCDFAIDEPELGRYRINASRQRTGIKASLRLISLEVPTLATLGLPEAIGAATHHHQGLIVLTGPTGHGKTTTLAAVVDILNAGTSRHVITVEDPIEFIHPRKRAMMSQREVGTHTKSFHSALKAALREDPDVIVIGELRDTETVRIALEASETGHLVLGTMSTPSASKAIDRLIDLFPPADQQQVRMTLAGGLRLIVSQRLLPDAEGKGMVAAAELLPGIVPLWNLIRDNRTYQIPSLQQRGKELGVIRLDDSLRDLVRAGRVTTAAAVAVAEAPDELGQVLAGRAQVQVPLPRPSAPEAQSPGAPGGGKGIFDRVFKKGG
jgi:twitching motility protein PilT